MTLDASISRNRRNDGEKIKDLLGTEHEDAKKVVMREHGAITTAQTNRAPPRVMPREPFSLQGEKVADIGHHDHGFNRKNNGRRPGRAIARRNIGRNGNLPTRTANHGRSRRTITTRKGTRQKRMAVVKKRGKPITFGGASIIPEWVKNPP